MAMRQLAERTQKPQILFGSGGRRIENQFLKSLNLYESKGIITTTGFTTGDKPGQYTVPHGKRNWKLYRDVYQKIGVVSNAIDNTANFAIQSGYELEGSQADKVKAQTWIEENNFNLILLNIMKQMQVFGNAYLEIDGPKLLPVENMFVVVKKGTTDDGQLIGYKQKLQLTGKGVEFKPEEIIHFKWRELTDFYGHSDIEPNIGILTKLLNFQEDVGEVMHNYAHPIIHYQLGTDEAPASNEQITDFITLRNELKTGEDLVTSANVNHTVIAADLRMMQIDGLLKHMENQLIAGLQVPEIFVRGGQSSNKATADVELQAFDRRVKALRAVVAEKLHDELFVPVLKADVTISWHEMSVESESLKAEMMVNLANSGVPTKVALRMTGWGSWTDDYEEEKKKEPQLPQVPPGQPPLKKPPMKRNEQPKEEDFDNQAEWLKAMEKWKTNKNESILRSD